MADEAPAGRRKSSRLRESTIKKEPGLDESTSRAKTAGGGGGGGNKRRKTLDKGKVTEPEPEPEPEPVKEPTPEPKTRIVLLPSKIVDGQQLPTLPDPQPKDLDPQEWQSVAE